MDGNEHAAMNEYLFLLYFFVFFLKAAVDIQQRPVVINPWFLRITFSRMVLRESKFENRIEPP